MSILVDEKTRALVQGMTGSEGSFHTRRCVEYGTKVVAGVVPGKGGTTFEGIPVFNSVEQAVKATGANVSLIFVPPAFAADAILESAEANLDLVVTITDGIPTLDMVKVHRYLQGRHTRLIGPNCPGIISPGQRCKVGIMPGDIHIPGPIGVISRSGTLTYEAVAQLTENGLGQTTCIGVGGDPLVGTTFLDLLKLFEADPETEGMVLIGEIGGNAEQDAAEFIKTSQKPVVAFVAGATAPPGRRMGHAGAIITGAAATAKAKIEALRAAGAVIADSPAEIGTVAKKVFAQQRHRR